MAVPTQSAFAARIGIDFDIAKRITSFPSNKENMTANNDTYLKLKTQKKSPIVFTLWTPDYIK